MSSKQRIVLLSVAVFLLLTAVFAVACDDGKATVYFVTDTDEQIAPVKRAIGGRMGELPTPQRENYKFEGWYTDKNGKNAVAETTMVREKAITLYAFWTFNLERKVRNDKIWVIDFASYAIDEDGKLYEWGYSKALTTAEREEMRYQYRPKHVIPDARFESTRGTVAIDVDGNIWCMYGNPMQPNSPYEPTQITSGVRFVQAEYGEVLGVSYQILAIDIDGKLWTASGALGAQTETSLKMIQTTVGFVSISVYENRWFAVDENGKLWAWGNNSQGLLGDGTKISPKYPINIAEGVEFVSVCAGSSWTYAIDKDGYLWSWGIAGHIGNGKRNPSFVPVQVSNDVKFVALGKAGFAIDADGGLWAWGTNVYGRIVGSNEGLVLSLTKVMPDKKFNAIVSDDGNALALDKNGNIWSWGSTQYGQRGDGTGEKYLAPFRSTEKGGVTAISATLANCRVFKIDTDGKLWAIGENNGRLGNGNYASEICFLPINETVKYKQVSAGDTHTLAIDVDGNLWSWGRNDCGQLGNGTKDDKSFPIQITTGTKFVQVVAGYSHSLAVDEDGNLWSWGYNNNGVLCDGTTTEKLTPTKVITEQKYTKIEASLFGSFLIDTDGYLWTCGANIGGMLGVKSSYVKVPQKVSETVKFRDISVGDEHVIAIDSDGNLWSWGQNTYGEVGNGTSNEQRLPVKITQSTRFVAVSAGERHSLAIDEKGNIWAWGDNAYGKLGNGTMRDSFVPIQVTNNTKFTQTVASKFFSMALDKDGNLYCWGQNRNGVFANGTSIYGEGLLPTMITLE